MALKKFLMVAVVAAVLVACGDDDSSDFATRPDGKESSSACEDCDGSSSSSKDVILSGDSREGSSESKSSSSSKAKSSSSVASSSSSLVGRIPCDINTDEDCFKDERDGQTYRTVKIGTQTWMAQNLNYETANSYCYKDYASNCTKYGRLYTWAAAMDSVGTWSANGKGCGYRSTCTPTYPVRGICPEGWHLPDTTEWRSLFTAVGGFSTAGKMLKSTSGWNDYSGWDGNGTDAYAFSALPAGNRGYDGNFHGEGNYAFFWSSTEDNSGNACRMYLGYSYDGAGLDNDGKDIGFSVRCLMD